MKIIPVLDLLNGLVVQGIRGERKNYKPLEKSQVSSSTNPLNVIRAFSKKFHLNYFYIADLDLIQKTKTRTINLEKIKEITKKTNFKIMVDGGCRTIEDIGEIFSLGVEQVVLGTETLDSLDILKQAIERYGNKKIILSIDLKGGQLLSTSAQLSKWTPIDIAKYSAILSLNAIIVLELQKVGSESGPLNETLLKIAEIVKEIPIFAGGGVRDIKDLKNLKEKGVSGALIATALHKGTINNKDLENFIRA